MITHVYFVLGEKNDIDFCVYMWGDFKDILNEKKQVEKWYLQYLIYVQFSCSVMSSSL